MNKVLILHQSRAYAGTDVFAMNMIIGLKKSGYLVELLVNSDNKDRHSFLNLCVVHFYKHKYLTAYHLSKSMRLFKNIMILVFFPILVFLHLISLYNQIKTISPDRIIIVNSGIPGGLMVYTGTIVCGFMGIKTLHTIHNLAIYNKYLAFYCYLIEKIISRFKCVSFVTVSKYNRSCIIKSSYFIKEVQVVLNGIDLCGQTLFCDDDNFNVVFIGNIQKQKGLSLLIQAFNLLPGDSDARLYIYGKIVEYDYYLSIKKDISDNPKISLYLDEHDKSKIFANKHLLVLPSICQESFGLVLIEAMSFGIPVLGSDDFGIKEIIELDDNLRAGETFCTADINAMAKSIESYMVDKKKYINYRANTVILFKKYFTQDRMIAEYTKLLR